MSTTTTTDTDAGTGTHTASGGTAVSAGFAATNPTTVGGARPGVRGISTPAPPTPPYPTVSAGFGTLNATTLSGTLPGIRGGHEKSVGELLASVDGFALALENRGGETALYAAADRPRNGLTKLTVTEEVNALASWQATLPANRALFRWAFARVVIGHDGERLFHGQLLPAKFDSSSQTVAVSGHGRLFELTSGGMDFSVSEGDGYEAINRYWREVATRTDGRVHGYCDPPPTGDRRPVGPEGFDASGTPLEVGAKLHDQFGYAFAMDHADRSGLVHSFRPGTVRREARWRATDHSIELDPTSYHNHVVIRGAEHPTQDRRYRGEARAPQSEINALTGGRRITYRPKPDDDLTSDRACGVRAQSKLDELRGEYAITGDVTVTPVHAVPGYRYHVPEFDAAVPEAARPVSVGLQKAEHTMLGGSHTKLDFSEDRGVVAALKRARNPLAGGIQRRQPVLVTVGTDGQMADAYSAEYPHEYPGPETPPAEIEAWGDAYWGAGAWGGTGSGTPTTTGGDD